MCAHMWRTVMEEEYCPREDTVRDIHATEDQLPNLSLYQTNRESSSVLQRAADNVYRVQSLLSLLEPRS